MNENIATYRPTIFLIEEDNAARSVLTTSLRKLGYRLLVAADLADAFEWISAAPRLPADLVLLNLVGKLPEEALSIGQKLREHANHDGNTPVVVLPEKVPQHLEGSDEKISDVDWICYYEDADQLRRLLEQLLPKTRRPVEG